MAERYFIVKHVKDLDSKVLLGKYGKRVKHLVDDGYITFKAADDMCFRKTWNALHKGLPFCYNVVKFDV